MEIPVIIEYARSFKNGFCLISANLNPYSENYSNELEKMVEPYIHKKYNNFTITGSIDLEDGMEDGQYVFVGEFSNHPKYGYQFKSDFYFQDIPSTEDGLVQFLMTLPNIKQARSLAIVKKFGVEGTFDVLDNNIYRLTEINGITDKRIEAIEKSYIEKKCMKDLYLFFSKHNMSSKLAEASFKKWGKLAKEIITKNPYVLTELRGVGFVMADKEAHKILDDIPIEFRTLACIKYVLAEWQTQESSLCSPYSLLKKNVFSLLQKCDIELGNKFDLKLYESVYSGCLKNNLNTFSIIKDVESKMVYVYFYEDYKKELYIAKELWKRFNSESKNKVCTEEDLILAEDDISGRLGKKITLDDKQKESIKCAFNNGISVITGAGGTGKSMLCRCIFKLSQEKNLSIRMMSPTGKAAQVLTEKTGCGASTIHRGLKIIPGQDNPQEEILEDILIIDEISMCGIDTIYAIFKAMENNKRGNIVFVGDKNQLPSVSPGNFLSDFINSGCVEVISLNKIHRQSEDSFISLIANEISKGKVQDIPENASDIRFRKIRYNYFNDDLIKFLDDYLKSNDIKDLQIMSPMKKGMCGVYKLNELVQEKMASIHGTSESCFEKGFKKFYMKDRVIQLENNYDKKVFNGDMGIIVDAGEKVIDALKSDELEKFVTVDFYGEEISFYGDEIEQLQLAWAITVHKFQGSQAPHILFLMSSEAQIMMSKELVYTAFTRAEKQLDIFGDFDMLRVAPMKSIVRKRYTNLVKSIESLKNGVPTFKVLGE